MHLGLAFALMAALVWTALDAGAGAARQSVPSSWTPKAFGLMAMIYLQILLGALVAGNDAGLVYNDWPLMNGALIPADYAGNGLWATLAHSQAAVQFNHRILAYLVALVTLALSVSAWRSRLLSQDARMIAAGLGGLVLVQVALGIATLMSHVPIGLAMAHQITAALLLALATAFAWRVRRT